MTEVQEAVTAADMQEDETAERPFLVRTYAADLTPGDGRTVDVRIVPYEVPAEVSDRGGPRYREEWATGCFDKQLRAANRVDVLMNFEHGRGPDSIIGHGVSLRSERDGLHGTFRMFAGQTGDNMLELAREGILGGVSLEAYAEVSKRTVEGIVRRVKARVVNVALCRTPAFADARVLAIREEISDAVMFEEVLLPLPFPPELAERCRRAGRTIPQRLQAHPAESDTPAESGTSADGTRQAET